LYAAFIIYAYFRMIVSWRASKILVRAKRPADLAGSQRADCGYLFH
jgi:hypothetical protein